MLSVLSSEEALSLIKNKIKPLERVEDLSVERALGRVLAEDICSGEYVPDFDRSTVDGYALISRDSFGCSEAIPALFTLSHRVEMGQQGGAAIGPGFCAYVPTGAALPLGADAVAMLEYCEDFGDGTIALSRPAAPGENIIFKGDDLCPGKAVLKAGRRINCRDMGTLAAMGISRVRVKALPVVGIISTGDELVEPAAKPGPGEIRDSNSALLAAMMREMGALPIVYGIVRDEQALLAAALERALEECDCVLISGGSSVGAKDATARVIAGAGQILFHGLAMKPGKPTILGLAGEKPVFGLPGHPGAVCFAAEIFVRAAIDRLFGRETRPITLSARLTESVSANHGRAQYGGVSLFREKGEWWARPIRSKSGLISSFGRADGYYCIPRDSEGCAAGDSLEITLYCPYQEV